ncbi:MAG: ATP-dependent sacrificial sulfur transferase LarE [Ignavibacteriae bacterium]|nr:ATP-dependent sacrificial sulfur transferase LarE [Ignavibacteriota bacterium]MCB9215667.1 ATP-dependent sacrificial sulfur transferase LarE [Ignavibacteria bacterium]
MKDREDLREVQQQLEEHIAQYRSVVVGFSAGVDSSVVAVAANAALGDNALIVTATTETIISEDIELARSIAQTYSLNYREIAYNELEVEGYAQNPTNRCFFCKDALHNNLTKIAEERGGAVILDGTNADDEGDYRPGRDAARNHGVRSPLLELGLDKVTVRGLAKLYSLSNHDKPSAPCLSSRVPYGTAITREILDKIGNAEGRLRDLGFRELRVRHHDDVARLELPQNEFAQAILLADAIDKAVRESGYRYVALDLRGFRSGSLNEVLTQIELPRG